MKSFLFFSLIIISIFLLSLQKENDNKILNQSENKIENENLNIKNNTSYLLNNQIYSLNDMTFDAILQKGNKYKWLVILYSQTCGHCEHARQEIRKVLPQYKNSTTIRFAEIEINWNRMTDIRFDVDGVPYIFLLQNNSIYEMELYPSEKNLIKFIETDFKDVVNELKPFPPVVPAYKVFFITIQKIFQGLTEGVNELLEIYGYKFQFTPLLLILSLILFFTSICILEYYCCSKFCPEEEAKKELIEEIKDNREKNEENEDKGKLRDDENNKKETEENKKMTEKEKIEKEIEIEKEKEMKEEKIRDYKDNKKNPGIKDKQKKKKKE